MSQPALVSIVVPAFRHERFVEACLRSIASQTHPRLELIFVDDCSPDRTFAIAEKFVLAHERRFERVRLVRHRANRGAHATLNHGLSLCTGEFISFMNSDDSYLPVRLEKLLERLGASGGELAFSRVRTIDEHGHPAFGSPLSHKIYWRPELMLRRMPSLSWGMLGAQLTASTGNMLVSRALAEKIGSFRPLKYCHDWDYILRACFYSEPVYVPEVLYEYRLHGENSFLALGELAVPETRRVVGDYLRCVMTGQPSNPLAPAPWNYPGSFEALLALAGHKRLFNSLYRPYEPHFRTITRQVANAGAAPSR